MCVHNYIKYLSAAVVDLLYLAHIVKIHLTVHYWGRVESLIEYCN